MSDIDAMRKAGATAEIAKELKLPVRTVKDILGEEVEDEKEEPKKEEDTEKLKGNEIQRKDDEIAMLEQKAETEKAKLKRKKQRS